MKFIDGFMLFKKGISHGVWKVKIQKQERSFEVNKKWKQKP